MSNDCEYLPGDIEGMQCWRGKKGLKRLGNWDCSRRYHWIKENEALAIGWMPEKVIHWLIIAESPPCPTYHDEPPYIYRITNQNEERPMLEAIVRAFAKASGVERILPSKEKKLTQLKVDKGAFLMDLCSYPLDRLNSRFRRASRKEAESELSSRLLRVVEIHRRQIENIVIVGTSWHRNALRAIDAAKMGTLVRNRKTRIPFPSNRRGDLRWQNDHEKCIDLLSRFFESPEYEKKHIPVRGEKS